MVVGSAVATPQGCNMVHYYLHLYAHYSNEKTKKDEQKTVQLCRLYILPSLISNNERKSSCGVEWEENFWLFAGIAKARAIGFVGYKS